MNSLSYWRMLIIICGLLVLGCKKETLPTEVSTTDQGNVTSVATASSALVYHENFQFPVDFTAPSVCAGEELHFTGYFHWNLAFTMDAKGGFHFVLTNNDHSLNAVGLTTGIKYHEVGATVQVFNGKGTAPQGGTFTITLNFIGQGPGNNAINRENFHYTINANGITTVTFDNSKEIRCQ